MSWHPLYLVFGKGYNMELEVSSSLVAETIVDMATAWGKPNHLPENFCPFFSCQPLLWYVVEPFLSASLGFEFCLL